MLDMEATCSPVVVRLPAEIDLANQEHAYDQLYAAAVSGAAVVVADFTATAFCDCASLRRLAAVRLRAAARGTEVRLAIRPGGLVRRMAVLMDLDHLVPVYASVREAAAAGALPGLNAQRLRGDQEPGCGTAA